MERDELSDWLRLTQTPGVGDSTARRLLAAFGLPSAVFGQSPAALRQLVAPALAEALLTSPPGLPALLDATWDWLQQGDGSRAVLALGDARYPASLLSIEDPPVLLYAMGRLDLRHEVRRSVAMVGSRNPTPQGALNARQFARQLREAGLTVVSGLALGIDGAAHEGALQAPDTGQETPATIAVVGTGLDRVYPRRHEALARTICEQGWLVSEYPLGTPPLAPNFPRRNRLIAGLAHATLVVEAAVQSGSLITARLAAEQGREVLAIPGSIHTPQSRGCHALIRQGAKLVESVQDVLEEFPAAIGPIEPSGSTNEPFDDSDDDVLRAMGMDPVSLDAIQARTGLATPQLQARLMALELQGQVARLPGGLLQRLVRA